MRGAHSVEKYKLRQGKKGSTNDKELHAKAKYGWSSCHDMTYRPTTILFAFAFA